jgi:hypothetical protein
MKEYTTPGPAYRAAAGPVSTKMPVPMIAPIPRAIRLPAPSDRLSVCSPVSDASPIIVLSDFVCSKFAIRVRFSFVAYPWARLAALCHTKYTGTPIKTRINPGHVY